MPPRSWTERVRDILEQIDLIVEHTAHVDEAGFVADSTLQGDTMYRIGVIGEAVAGIPGEVKDKHPEVPWRIIRNMRNVLTHVYFQVDMARVWAVVAGDLAPLRCQLSELLAADGEAPDA